MQSMQVMIPLQFLKLLTLPQPGHSQLSTGGIAAVYGRRLYEFSSEI